MASMNPFLMQAPIPNVKHILAVGSGKGGVGKSTLAVNLALALKKQGNKVGVLDADVYGPSIPRMLGVADQRPEINEDKKIVPITAYGLKLMSMGFMVAEGLAVVWRGPMLFKAMEQFIRDVDWGELDYLIVDLPPGTGDVALTLAQKVPVNGAIVVCTPQNIALADAKKAMDMFDRINVRLLGVVENMASFQTPSGEVIELFPRGELDAFLKLKGIPKLGKIPFDPIVGQACEAGVPYLESVDDPNYLDLATALAEKMIKPSRIEKPETLSETPPPQI
jgi:ATP-binding protein involved in chromosome partitioning